MADEKRILVVEDDAQLRLALDLRLRASGYATAFAPDGETAVRSAKDESPDVILLDLGLPKGDGFQVMADLQQDPALRSIPVVVLTGRDPSASETRARELGAFAFLQKPVENAELIAVIEDALAA